MFENLTSRITSFFGNLQGVGKISERNIREVLREIRMILLEADVNFKVAKRFIDRVRERALGAEVTRSVTPAQQMTKIIYDELVALLGGDTCELPLNRGGRTVIMLAGLQGAGKTTAITKLAKYLEKQDFLPLMVAGDLSRPAAVEQLKINGGKAGVPVYAEDGATDVPGLCQRACAAAEADHRNLVLIDTAGRLHVDDGMMDELVRVREAVQPDAVLLVMDGMSGQDALTAAAAFRERVPFDGFILTKLDGDARGGAALSVREVTGRPIMFISSGEGFDQFDKFHPDRIASRILGKGDVVSLVEKAQEVVDEEAARRLEEKLRTERFDLNDFLDQLRQLKRMGPLSGILEMMPGAGKMFKGGMPPVDDASLKQVEAIICSMTGEERGNPAVINGSRRRRIAAGSGTSVQDVNRLLKQFAGLEKMLKNFGKGGKRKGMPFPIKF